MRVVAVAVTFLGGCLLQSCGGSSRLRCGEGTEERDGECVVARSETGGRGTGGRGGSEPRGGNATGGLAGQGGASGASSPQGGTSGASSPQGGTSGASSPQGGASGAPDPQGGAAGIADGGEGGAEPGDPTSSEVEDAQALCALPEAGIVEVSSIETQESLLVGRWLRCGGAMFFGREAPGIRFSADHTWHFLESVDTGGLVNGAGFDNFGTWSVVDNFNGNSFQVNIALSGAGENYVFPIFATEPSKMRWSTMLGTIDFAFIGKR